MTGAAACCARAANGHAPAALATSVTKSRRFIVAPMREARKLNTNLPHRTTAGCDVNHAPNRPRSDSRSTTAPSVASRCGPGQSGHDWASSQWTCRSPSPFCISAIPTSYSMRSTALSRRLIGISAECPAGLHVHDEGRTCLPLRSEAAGSGPTKDTVDVDCRLPVMALVVHPIGHESALSTTTRTSSPIFRHGIFIPHRGSPSQPARSQVASV